VIEQVNIGRVAHLPDALQVRPPVGHPRNRCRGSRRLREREGGSQNQQPDAKLHRSDYTYTNESFSGDNIPAALEATGFSAAGQIRESWDINPAIGGPIIRDRLWFYGSYRHWGDEVDGGVYYNLTPTAWQYTPDVSRKTAATDSATGTSRSA
jgi:hypothetical protein